MSEGPDFTDVTDFTPGKDAEERGGRLERQAILFCLGVMGCAVLMAVIAAIAVQQHIKERNQARAQVIDLQKQLDELKAQPRFQGDGLRFIAVSRPHRQTILSVDGTIVLRASDVPDLAQKVLDWLVRHPEEIRKRGIVEIKARIL